MTCSKNCEECKKPHKVGSIKWCYDSKYGLPALKEGTERKGGKRVISLDAVPSDINIVRGVFE